MTLAALGPTAVYGIFSGAILCPLVVSFNLVCGTSRVFHFPHATLCLLSSYVAWRLSTLSGLPLVVSVVLGILAASASAVILAQVVYLPLLRRRASETALLMAALGSFLVLESAAVLAFTPDSHVFLAQSARPILSWHLLRVSSTQVWLMLAVTAALVAAWLLLHYTRLGLHIRAYGGSPELALALGVPEQGVLLSTFALTTAMGSVTMMGQVAYAGVLSPEDSLQAAVAAAACSALLGVRRPFLGVPAALLLGLGQSLSGLLLGSRWQGMAVLVVLAVGLALRRRTPLEA